MEGGNLPPFRFSFLPHACKGCVPPSKRERERSPERRNFLEISGELKYFIVNIETLLEIDLRSCFPSRLKEIPMIFVQNVYEMNGELFFGA